MSASDTKQRPVIDGVAPPPASPTYDRAFGNQFRWAKQVLSYALAQAKSKSEDVDEDTSSKV